MPMAVSNARDFWPCSFIEREESDTPQTVTEEKEEKRGRRGENRYIERERGKTDSEKETDMKKESVDKAREMCVQVRV